MYVVISSEYLKPIEEFSRDLSVRFCGFKSYESFVDNFYLLNPVEVMGFFVVEDVISRKGLRKMLDKITLWASEDLEPKLIISTLDGKDTEGLGKLYPSVHLGLIEYPAMSMGVVQRMYSSIFFEHFDIHKGKAPKIQEIKQHNLPGLRARKVLSRSVTQIFSSIEFTHEAEDNLKIDQAYKNLKSIHKVLGLLREMIIFKAFGKKFDSSELSELISQIEDDEQKLEYRLIFEYIGGFDAKILRKFKPNNPKIYS